MKLKLFIWIIVFGLILYIPSIYAVTCPYLRNETFNDASNFSIAGDGGVETNNNTLFCNECSFRFVHALFNISDGNNYTVAFDMAAVSMSAGMMVTLNSYNLTNPPDDIIYTPFSGGNVIASVVAPNGNGFGNILTTLNGAWARYEFRFKNNRTVEEWRASPKNQLSFNQSGFYDPVRNTTFLTTSTTAGKNFKLANLTLKNDSAVCTTADVTNPIVNVSLNNTSPKRYEFLNITANLTDETALSTANITINFSTGIIKINYTISGTSIQISNSTQITDSRGNVINITVYTTDTSSNVKQNSTLITVADTLGSAFIGLNLTSPKINNIINISGNCTDVDSDFSLGTINYNLSGNPQLNFSFSGLIGTKGNFSQNVTINLTRGNVINFTVFCNDTINTAYQNSTLITVADTLGSMFIFANNTASKINSIVNISCNATDIDKDFAFGYLSYNISGNPQLNFSYTSSLGIIKFNFSQNITINLTRGNVINFTVFYNDTVGTQLQNSTLITIDNTPPNATSIINISDKFYNKNQTLNWTESSNPDNVNIFYLVYYNTTQNTVLLSNTTNLNATTNFTADGNYSFFINATDTINTTSSNTAYKIVLDTKPPTFAEAFNRTADSSNSTSITTATSVNLTIFGLDDLYLDRGNFSENCTLTSRSWINHSITIIGNNTPYYNILTSDNFTAGQICGWKFYVFDIAGNRLDPVYTFSVNSPPPVPPLPVSYGATSGGGGGLLSITPISYNLTNTTNKTNINTTISTVNNNLINLTNKDSFDYAIPLNIQIGSMSPETLSILKKLFIADYSTKNVLSSVNIKGIKIISLLIITLAASGIILLLILFKRIFKITSSLSKK